MILRHSVRSEQAESVRSGKLSWVMLGQLAVGQMTQRNPSDFVGSTGPAAKACVPG